MPTGGHARSGPAKTPGSARSERAGFRVTDLPNGGYTGTVPNLATLMPSPTRRHLEVWARMWTYPQACAWSLEEWRWSVAADLCQLMVRFEQPDSPIALTTPIRQLRDDLGLSTAGLRANGWSIKADELATKTADAEPAVSAPSRRLRAG